MVWIILICLVIVLILLASRIFVSINLILSEDEHHIKFILRLYNIPFFKKNIQLTNNESGQKEPAVTKHTTPLKGHLRDLKRFKKVLLKALQQIRFHQLKWHTKVGLQEADLTGLAAGGIWSVKNIITAMLNNHSDCKTKPDLTVIPCFNQSYLKTKFDCMFSLTVGQIIYIAYVLLHKN